jgi:hypothetical protein
MSVPTLDEWVEIHGLQRLREQIQCHCSVFISGDDEAAETLTRLIMISLRDDVERNAPVLHGRFTPETNSIGFSWQPGIGKEDNACGYLFGLRKFR